MGPPIPWDMAITQNFTLKIYGQGHGSCQRSPPWTFMVKVMAKVKPDGHIWGLEFNWYVCFPFRLLFFFISYIDNYSEFHIWPWKFKVKVMTKVKPDGHTWGLEINRYNCFLSDFICVVWPCLGRKQCQTKSINQPTNQTSIVLYSFVCNIYNLRFILFQQASLELAQDVGYTTLK